jgi:hypothetical protein
LQGVQHKGTKRSSQSKSYGHPSKQAKPFVVIHDFPLLNLDTNGEVNHKKPKVGGNPGCEPVSHQKDKQGQIFF